MATVGGLIMDPISPALLAAAIASISKVTMVLCMLCQGGDGYSQTLKFPTMNACTTAATKISRSAPKAVAVCLLDPQFIRDELATAKLEAGDDAMRRGGVEVCGLLGSFERYQFANMESCVYTFSGPSYRSRHDAPNGYIDYDGLPPARE